MSKYQEEADRLSELTSKEIFDHWNQGFGKSCLFRRIEGLGMCLTEIKYGCGGDHYDGTNAVALKLEAVIQADERIPNPLDTETIDPESLVLWVEWQERIDREYPEVR